MIWRTRKDKIYLDTSVMSHLSHEDVPGKMADTLSFWEDVEAGMYDVVISEATLAELRMCDEPKRSALLDAVKTIDIVSPTMMLKGGEGHEGTDRQP